MTTADHRRADIQGLRAVAILAVVVFHAWPQWLPGGYVGVDVFFVVSGHLITGLLLREVDATGRVDFAGFYARRIRRLLPAATLVTMACLAVQLVRAPWDMRELAATAAAAALYASNLWFAHLSVDYLQAGLHRNLLLHTWSLAMEEQFYLVWPALVAAAAALSRRGGPRAAVAWAIALVTAASFAAGLWLGAAHPEWAFFSLPTRAWELGLGAGACLLERSGWRPAGRWRQVLSAGGLLCIAVAAWGYSAATAFPGHAALLPTVGAVLVVLSGAGGLPAATGVLGSRPLQWLGDLSYAWYLWHWPVLLVLADLWPSAPGWQPALLGVLVSLGLARATQVLVESPVRHGSLSQARPARSLGLGLGLTLLTLGVAAATHFLATQGPWEKRRIERAARDHPRLYGDNCLARAPDRVPPTCIYGRKDGRHTVVLLGDSHAAQWFPAIEKLARAHGARLAVFVKAACPVATVEPFDAKLNRPYTECTAWREAVLQQLVVLRPTLVIASQSSFYEAFVRDDATQLAAWRDGWQTTLARLDGLGSQLVVLQDTPRPPSHVPRCLGQAWSRRDTSPHRCTFPLAGAVRPNARALERQALQDRRHAAVVDMTDTVCTAGECQVQRHGMVLYHDAQHLSASFASALSDELWRRLPATAQAAMRGH